MSQIYALARRRPGLHPAGTRVGTRAGNAVVALVLGALTTATIAGTAQAATVRVAALHPFSSTAPANTAIGSGAAFESSTSTRTAALLGGKPVINAESWSIAVAIATSSDPLATLTNSRTGAKISIRVPSGAQVTAGTDKNMTVVQPDGFTAYDCYKMTQISPTEWTSSYIVKTDLRTTGLSGGVRAAGVSQLMGLIRADEVAAKTIPHTLAVAIPDSMLKSGQVWPARAQDSNAATAYKGPIPMGTMFALPASVNVTTMGLSAEGLALAHALQDYGAHVLERAGTVALYAEPRSDSAALERMRTDWRKLFPLMRAVTNNTPTNISGGGARRQPAAAPLA